MDRLVADLLAIIRQSAVSLLGLLPYVVAGAALGALLLRRRASLIPAGARFAALPRWVLVAAGAVLGTISPLCTMGSVPLVIGLIGSGMPVSVGVAFLSASSLANPQILIIAAGTVGPVLAAAQWACAVGIACSTGLVALACERRGIAIVHANLKRPDDARHRHGPKGFLRSFADQVEHVLIYVVVGVVAASVVNVCVPGGVVRAVFARGEYLAVAGGALASMPLYVCGGGVLPLLAELVAKGLPPGAALAFMVAGPATRLQALAALAALVRRRPMVGYVALVWLWAVAAGVLTNLLGPW